MVISFVGSGGKTTAIFTLAAHLREQGRRVLVTTTTRMYTPLGLAAAGRSLPLYDDRFFSREGSIFDIQCRLERDGFCLAGVIPPGEDGHKLAPLPPSIYEKACLLADDVLVEADGARSFFLKYPAPHEPVIPANTEEIRVLYGHQAVGRPLGEVTQRLSLALEILRGSGFPHLTEDTPVTPAIVGRLYERGYLTPLRKRFSHIPVKLFSGGDGERKKLGCVVMASGFSRRFGENKLLCPFRGKPLFQWCLEALPMEELERVTVVTRYPQLEPLCREFGVTLLLHDHPARSDTIRLGVETMEGLDGCLFTVADQPLCRRETLTALVTAFRVEPGQPARLSWGEKMGNPVLFPAGLFSSLAALKGEQGGGCVLPEMVTQLPVSHPDELTDVDTPETLAELERSDLDGTECSMCISSKTENWSRPRVSGVPTLPWRAGRS